MTMGSILLVVLFISLVASLLPPARPRWGYGPPGILGLLVVLLLVLIFKGVVPLKTWNWGPPPAPVVRT
jgi:hypothetical protein